jgi:hypothetical protein
MDVIVTSGTAPAIACKKATANGQPPIPVVYAAVGDPEGSGLRPGNMTGGWNQQSSPEMAQARMNHLIAEWNKKPQNAIGTLGVVYNNLSPPSSTEMGLAVAAAGAAGIQNHLYLPVNTQKDIQDLSTAVCDAFYVCSDPLVTEYLDDIPKKFAVHAFAEHCDDHGGPCSFGPNGGDLCQPDPIGRDRQAAKRYGRQAPGLHRPDRAPAEVGQRQREEITSLPGARWSSARRTGPSRKRPRDRRRGGPTQLNSPCRVLERILAGPRSTLLPRRADEGSLGWRHFGR